MVINVAANDHKVVYYDCKRIKRIYIVNKKYNKNFHLNKHFIFYNDGPILI